MILWSKVRGPLVESDAVPVDVEASEGIEAEPSLEEEGEEGRMDLIRLRIERDRI